MCRIGIDIVSGEESPQALFLSLVEYSLQNIEDQFYIFIDEETLDDDHQQTFNGTSNIIIVPVLEKILMDDNPIKSIKKKRSSSIVTGLEYLHQKKIDFFFSPGNTGALVYGASYYLGLVKDISFPAIAVLIPNIFGEAILLDAGASYYIDEDRGFELAVMGDVLCKNLMNLSKPEIGLLNLGKEWHKGPKWVRKLNLMLEKDKSLNYFGYVEGFDVMTSKCNVYVTGGYTGNLMLKGVEGVYYYLRHMMKEKKMDEMAGMLKSAIHYSRTGAGLVLGTKLPVFTGHGVTNPEALKNALVFCKKIYKLNLAVKIEREMRKRSILSKIWNRRSK
jgi:glycerol-3-phosphate acyltransferase PlsX